MQTAPTNDRPRPSRRFRLVTAVILGQLTALFLGMAAASAATIGILTNRNEDVVAADFNANVGGHTFVGVNVSETTPTLDSLLAYDAVLLFEDGIFSNAVNVGNRVAEYANTGRAVVLGTFYEQDRSDAYFGGTWGALETLDPNTTDGVGCPYSFRDLDPASIVPHPLTLGVTALSSESYAGGNEAKAGSTVLATWNQPNANGNPDPAIALRVTGPACIVHIGILPGYSSYIIVGYGGDFYQVWRNAMDFAAAGCTICGDGSVDAGEQCDDGNTADGDCCSSTCQYESSGSPCDDATVCNGSETCDGAGACTPGISLDCDDGNGCTSDGCDPQGGCVNDDAPATGCLQALKSVVLIKDDAEDDTRDKLLWKWIKGGALEQEDLADPTGSDGYALCIYAGTGQALIADAALPPGMEWSAVGDKGYKFKGTSPDGLSLALLKGGDADKSKALAKGKGATLPDPTLPLAYPVTVQLKKAGAPLCLESSFTAAEEKRNDARQFKAKR